MLFNKVLCLCCVVASVIAAPAETSAPGVIPLEKQQPTVIPIVSQSEEVEANGTYKFSYETGNGIKREETSFDKTLPKIEGRSAGSGEGGEDTSSEEIHVQQGSYSYTAPDGTVISVRYIADENGFQPIGDHIPKVASPVQSVAPSGSGEKSGRSLNADSSPAASAPVALARSAGSSSPPAASSDKADLSSKASSEASTTEGAKEASTTEASEPTTASAEGMSTTGGESEATTVAGDKTSTAAESSEATAAAAESEVTKAPSAEPATSTTLAPEASSTEAPPTAVA